MLCGEECKGYTIFFSVYGDVLKTCCNGGACKKTLIDINRHEWAKHTQRRDVWRLYPVRGERVRRLRDNV